MQTGGTEKEPSINISTKPNSDELLAIQVPHDETIFSTPENRVQPSTMRTEAELHSELALRIEQSVLEKVQNLLEHHFNQTTVASKQNQPPTITLTDAITKTKLPQAQEPTPDQLAQHTESHSLEPSKSQRADLQQPELSPSHVESPLQITTSPALPNPQSTDPQPSTPPKPESLADQPSAAPQTDSLPPLTQYQPQPPTTAVSPPDQPPPATITATPTNNATPTTPNTTTDITTSNNNNTTTANSKADSRVGKALFAAFQPMRVSPPVAVPVPAAVAAIVPADLADGGTPDADRTNTLGAQSPVDVSERPELTAVFGRPALADGDQRSLEQESPLFGAGLGQGQKLPESVARDVSVEELPQKPSTSGDGQVFSSAGHDLDQVGSSPGSKGFEDPESKHMSASEKLSAPRERQLTLDGGSLESVKVGQPPEDRNSRNSRKTLSVISAFDQSPRKLIQMTTQLAAEAIKRFCIQVLERRRLLLPFRILREIRDSGTGSYLIVIYKLEKVLSIRVAELKKRGFYDFLYLKLDENLNQLIQDPDFLKNNIVVLNGKIHILDGTEQPEEILARDKKDKEKEQIRDDLLNQVSVIDDSSESERSDDDKHRDNYNNASVLAQEPRVLSLNVPKSQFHQQAVLQLQTADEEDYPPIPLMALTRSHSLVKDYLPTYDFGSLMDKPHMFEPEAKLRSGGLESNHSSNGSKQGTRQDILRLNKDAHEISLTSSQRRISSPSVFHAPVSKHSALSRDTKELGLPENLRFKFVSSRWNTEFWIVVKELSRGGFFIVELENSNRQYIESLVFEAELVGLLPTDGGLRTPKERAEWLVWKIAPALGFIPGTGKPVVLLGDDLVNSSKADMLCISGKYF